MDPARARKPLQRAMLAGQLAGGSALPIAQYFGMTPRMLRCVLREIRRAFTDFFAVPVKSLDLRYLYR